MKRIISILLLIVMLSSALEAFAELSYTDITNEHWAAEYIKILTNRGILFGTPDGKILPDDNITRAEISAMVSRTYDSNEYVDMSKVSFDDIQGHWAQKDIERLVDKNIILKSEYGNLFNPDRELTRIEMIRLVLRWLQLSEEADNYKGNTSYVDDSMIEEADKGYVAVAKKYGIISGYPDNSVRPYGKITRGEVFKIFSVAWNISIMAGEETPEPSMSAASISPSPASKTSGGSSSSSANRKAVVDFSLPDFAHTDTQLEIVTKNSYVKSLEWILRKYDAEAQCYADVQMNEYVEGALASEGGNFKFKSCGKFRLCAIAENSRGKKYEYSKDITVYDTISVTVQAPETTHTDMDIVISTFADKEFSDCTGKWSILFDGENVDDLSEYVDATLDSSNNTVKLTKSGMYTITYTVADATGREFNDSQTVKVYPASGVKLSVLQSAMAGENITVNAMSDLTLEWYIKSGDNKIPYEEYADGVLSDKGGQIRFEQAGKYTLCAVGTDETGREFTDEREIIIYPVPSLEFILSETAHTDVPISVITDFQNTDGLSVQWYICRNATGYKEYNVYIDGELSDDGGSVRFKDAGVYSVKAEVTNEIGRIYKYTQKVTVYPVPELSFNAVQTTHTDTIIPITQTDDLSGYDVQWYISKDGSDRKLYSEYTTDTLNAQGGNIMLTEKGEYVLILCTEDNSGRIFEYSQNITVMPVADIGFTLPSVAHTDTEINVAAAFVNIDTADVTWTIDKGGEKKDYKEYADGTLDNNGGSIRFKEAGDYTVTARFQDTVGRSYETSKQIKVYNIPVVEYAQNGLPSYAYADSDIIVKPEISNLEGLNIEWQINGNSYTEYVTGTLDNSGGTVRFKSKGHYKLTAQITDETGRKFSYSSETDIYPVPQISCTLPTYTHTDMEVELETSVAEFDGNDIIWNISKDGGEYQNYAVFAEGVLNNNGGNLRFKNKGTYTIKAIAVDCNGSIFEYTSGEIKVYPVPAINVIMPVTTHTDESVNVITNLDDMENLDIVWSVSKDNEESEAVNNLTNNGGQLMFDEKGTYTLLYSATDEVGRTFGGSSEISVYPVTRLSFILPQYSHTDNAAVITTDFYEANNDVIWYVDSKENKDLDVSGGSLNLEKGIHTITVEMTDDAGRIFSESKDIQIYPVPIAEFGIDSDAEFALPVYGYRDKNITLIPALKELDGLQIKWLISRDGQDARDYTAYVQGTMTNDGGNITFTNTGSYTLTAQITDETGRVFEYSEDIIINSIPDVSFKMDEHSYTDSDINIVNEAEGEEIKWMISKDSGQLMDYSEYVSGTLYDNGGTVHFNSAGTYTVVMYVTDVSGSIYSYMRKIKVLALPNMDIRIPEYAYTNENVMISSENENMTNLNVQWYINDKPYQTYAEGTLSNSGGSVKFPIDGTYTIKAIITDEYGRNYEFESEQVIIYPDLTPKFALPLYSYTDADISVSVATGCNIVWTINGQPYAETVSGTLTDDGGKIQFSQAGDYTVTATVTDENSKEFVYSQSVIVYAVSTLGIELSKSSAYVGESVTVIANTDGNITWSIVKDSGEKQNYLTYASGSLTNSGGELAFKEIGTYEIAAVITDELGKTYTETAAITITENPEVTLSIDKKTAYVSEAVRVSTELANMEGSSISWYIAKDGERKSYNDYVTGTLSNYGGNIYFLQSGEYTVYAVLTDNNGKETEYTSSVTIFARTGISITTPETGYIGISNKVITSISNEEWKNISWYISKDGASRKNYLEYADGTLSDNGGQITFNNVGTYILYADLTDNAGTKITASESITIYEVPTADIIVPDITHTGTPITVTATFANASNSVAWYVSKDNGSEKLYTTYCSGTLSKSGGQISFNSYGTYKLIARMTDAGGTTRDFSTTIRVYPTPNLTTSLTSRMHIGDSYSASYSVTKWGNQTIEWKLEKDGTPVDMNNYGTFDFSGGYIRTKFDTLGTYTLVAYVEDETEKVFRYDIPIEVYNTVPDAPTIKRTPNTISVSPGTPILMSANTADPDGDEVYYEWEGLTEDGIYPLGKNIVRCYAVDEWGAKSPSTAVVFFVADERSGGGMELVDAESRIVEEGIEGTTIVSYEFNVPSVAGHSGSDYGQVQGYNVSTGEWELIEKRSTTNGITMTGTLEPGKYNKLEFFYYASHCMYNKCNITYNVEYYFPAE